MPAAATLPEPRSPRLQRAEGWARLAFRRVDGAIRLQECHQYGCCKIKLPRVLPGEPPEAVLLNTAGGVTGGDRLEFQVELGDGARASIATQAAERIYRRSAGTAEVTNRLSVGAAGHLDWLPQETILFDRSALSRSLEVDLAEGATALLVESIVFGRQARGEAVRELALSDRWRIRRSGRLIYADAIAIDGDAHGILAGGATGGGGVAVATLVAIDPMLQARLPELRERLAGCGGEGGISAFGEVLVVRLLAASSHVLRQDVIGMIEAMRGRPMPRVWYC